MPDVNLQGFTLPGMLGALAPRLQRPAAVITLRVLYRSRGIQLAIQDDDRVEIWNGPNDEPYFTVTGAFLKMLVIHHLDGLTMQAVIRGAIDAGTVERFIEMPKKEAHPVDSNQRGQLRARRKSRKA